MAQVLDLIERKLRPMREDEKNKAPLAAKLPVDQRGRVSVWQIAEKRWVVLHPVDAREQLNRGIVALQPPAEAKAAPPPAEPEVKADAEVPEPGVSHLPSVHLPDLTVKALEQYVADNGLDVDLSKLRLKEEKVEAVRKAIEAKHKAEG
jgi:hypothetical protein